MLTFSPQLYMNIRCVEELILGNTRITVYDIASNSGASVETIIHGHYCSQKCVSGGTQRY
jgi:hypothetical protein